MSELLVGLLGLVFSYVIIGVVVAFALDGGNPLTPTRNAPVIVALWPLAITLALAIRRFKRNYPPKGGKS